MKPGLWLRAEVGGRALALQLALLLVSGSSVHGAMAKRVISEASAFPRTSRLQNSQLERVRDRAFVGWGRYGAGYEVDPEVRHTGRFSGRCRNTSASDQRGISQTAELNQQVVLPIVAECWSKADKVSGGADADYSLYLDLEYVDGTPLWGRLASFDAGTHDWQRRTATVMPSKPVKRVTVYGLLRNRTGTAWFDDFRLWQIEVADGVTQFDGIAVELETTGEEKRMGGPVIESDDGFCLAFDARHGDVFTSGPGGFLLRDAAARSDFVRPAGTLDRKPDGSVVREATDKTLGISLSATYRSIGKAIRVDGTVRDLTGHDRAISVYLTYPVDAVGWQWHDDQRATRRIEEGQKYQNVVNVAAGANGFASRYPVACIAGEKDAVAMAIPLDVPRLCRLGYDAESRELYAAIDLGLSSETARFPSSASFSLVLYRPNPEWGFRSALERYYQLFPQCFTKRNQQEGIWMPFTDIATVQGFADFGFRFKEGDNNVAFDHEHGIYSFVYVEPWSNWLPLPAEVERTPEEAIALLQRRAAEGSERDQATLTSVMQKADGQWCVRMEKQPWCDGAVIGVNPSPGVPGEGGRLTQYQDLWRRIDQAFARSPQLTGVYHDSFEMYLFPNQLNYRREHFREATIPLVFDSEGRVCQYAMFSMVEFAREVARRMWSRGGLTFANGTPHSFPWGAAWLDVMGTEAAWSSSWGRFGEYRPESDRDFNYWRAMCYQRPYLMLLNTRFELWKPEWIEQYMKRCAAYAVFPSMFSYNASDEPYWQRPELYERDRPLFRKYIPLISALSAAGWEPVTWARSSNPRVYLERFGNPPGKMWFTALNDSDEAQQAEISVAVAVLQPGARGLEFREALSGEALRAESAGDQALLRVVLPPQDLKVLEMQ